MQDKLLILDGLNAIRQACNHVMTLNKNLPDTERVAIHIRISEIRRLNAELTEKLTEEKPQWELPNNINY